MDRLKEIIEKIFAIEDGIDGEIKFSPDVVLDCATRIYNAEKIKANGKSSSGDNMATSKQKIFLNKLGYTGDKEQLTKKDASRIISEMVNSTEY